MNLSLKGYQCDSPSESLRHLLYFLPCFLGCLFLSQAEICCYPMYINSVLGTVFDPELGSWGVVHTCICKLHAQSPPHYLPGSQICRIGATSCSKLQLQSRRLCLSILLTVRIIPLDQLYWWDYFQHKQTDLSPPPTQLDRG